MRQSSAKNFTIEAFDGVENELPNKGFLLAENVSVF